MPTLTIRSLTSDTDWHLHDTRVNWRIHLACSFGFGFPFLLPVFIFSPHTFSVLDVILYLVAMHGVFQRRFRTVARDTLESLRSIARLRDEDIRYLLFRGSDGVRVGCEEMIPSQSLA